MNRTRIISNSADHQIDRNVARDSSIWLGGIPSMISLSRFLSVPVDINGNTF